MKGFSDLGLGRQSSEWGPQPEIVRVPACWDCSCVDVVTPAEYIATKEGGKRTSLCYDHLVARGYTPTHERVRRA